MFEPWKVQVEETITVEQKYGTPNPPIPTGFRAIAFRPPKKGENWLGRWAPRVIAASDDYPCDAPVLILAPALTEIEEKYGEGATPESVWAKHCPCPEKYGKPKFGDVAAGRPFAVIHYAGRRPTLSQDFTGEYGINFKIIHAYKLNDWQQVYGEDITDAAALEAKLRAEGRLESNQFIEPEMREPLMGDRYVCYREHEAIIWSISTRATNGPLLATNKQCRAIVGTRKRRFLKVPLRDDNHIELGACGQYSRDTFQRGRIYIVHECAVLGAQIIEE
jgi:hypothetical protein